MDPYEKEKVFNDFNIKKRCGSHQMFRDYFSSFLLQAVDFCKETHEVTLNIQKIIHLCQFIGFSYHSHAFGGEGEKNYIEMAFNVQCLTLMLEPPIFPSGVRDS